MLGCETLNFSLVPRLNPTAQYCACGELLDHEAEIDAGQCFDCQADEAGIEMPDPQATPLFTAAELDQLCGVTHRRRAS